MYKKLESKEDILQESIELVKVSGFKELNIRGLAKQCDVSVGTIYNYFPSKQELLVETVEMIWRKVFHNQVCDYEKSNFLQVLNWLETCLRNGAKEFPDFLSKHNQYFSGKEVQAGKKQMSEYFEHMQRGILYSLQEEKKLCKTLEVQCISQKDFIDYVIWSLVDCITNNRKTDVLIKMIETMN
ncbi:MAG: TetR/AcrR family transcriptional regulator [Longicatena sp.]|uniref:TetR/AcrR family transcriptional regulator n=1 Tax=Anaerorhabdus sp. TaxID=1872524 RepID=UPI002FC5FE32